MSCPLVLDCWDNLAKSSSKTWCLKTIIATGRLVEMVNLLVNWEVSHRTSLKAFNNPQPEYFIVVKCGDVA
jgi:hypothetical protein